MNIRLTHEETKRIRSGFTMGEMIIVIAIIAILAALIAPLAVNVIEQKRVDASREELVNIKQALIGDPSLIEGGTRSSYGFLGDVGALPVNLSELVSNTQARPVFQQYGTTGMFYGWRGPYIGDTALINGGPADPWGNAYNYSNTIADLPANIVARIWSNGANGVNNSGNGNAIGGDDISIDVRRDEAFAWVSGNTLDQCDCNYAYSSVYVTYPNGAGVVTTLTTKSTTVANPVFLIKANDIVGNLNPDIPIGIRLITYAYIDPATGATVNPIPFKLIHMNSGPVVTVNLRTTGACI